MKHMDNESCLFCHTMSVCAINCCILVCVMQYCVNKLHTLWNTLDPPGVAMGCFSLPDGLLKLSDIVEYGVAVCVRSILACSRKFQVFCGKKKC